MHGLELQAGRQLSSEKLMIGRTGRPGKWGDEGVRWLTKETTSADSAQPLGNRAVAHATGAPSRVFVHNSGCYCVCLQGLLPSQGSMSLSNHVQSWAGWKFLDIDRA